MMIDAHCHYDMFENPKKIIDECEKQQIITLGMTNLPSHFELGYPHVQKYKHIRLALGLHPLLAEAHKSERHIFLNNMDKTSYIGEVGLDFSKEGVGTKLLQLESFEFVLDSIKNKKKIISIHSRRAEKEVLELLKKYNIKNAIFHWYSGDEGVLEEIIENEYFFSINPMMTINMNGQKLISKIPLDIILTETDSPYTKIGERRTKPNDVSIVLNYFSKMHNLPIKEIEKKIYNNFSNLIGSIR